MNTIEYNTCVNEYADQLFRFSLSTMKDIHKAEDVVQVVFERLWVERESIEMKKVKSWLFTVGHRYMIDQIRRKQTEAKVLNIQERQQQDECGRQYEIKDLLHQALEQVSDIQKQVLLLRDYQGYSYEEIAEITDLSLSQVKVYIFRARKKMKQTILKLEKVN